MCVCGSFQYCRQGIKYYENIVWNIVWEVWELSKIIIENALVFMEKSIGSGSNFLCEICMLICRKQNLGFLFMSGVILHSSTLTL